MLQANFVMIYIIYKISILLKIVRSLKHFLKSIVDFHFYKEKLIFFTTYNHEKFKA